MQKNLIDHDEQLTTELTRVIRLHKEADLANDISLLSQIVGDFTNGLQDFLTKGKLSKLQKAIDTWGGDGHKQALQFRQQANFGGRKNGMEYWRQRLADIWLEMKNDGKEPHQIKSQLLMRWGKFSGGHWDANEGLLPWQNSAFDSLKKSKIEAVKYEDNLLRSYQKRGFPFKPVLEE